MSMEVEAPLESAIHTEPQETCQAKSQRRNIPVVEKDKQSP